MSQHALVSLRKGRGLERLQGALQFLGGVGWAVCGVLRGQTNTGCGLKAALGLDTPNKLLVREDAMIGQTKTGSVGTALIGKNRKRELAADHFVLVRLWKRHLTENISNSHSDKHYNYVTWLLHLFITFLINEVTMETQEWSDVRADGINFTLETLKSQIN